MPLDILLNAHCILPLHLQTHYPWKLPITRQVEFTATLQNRNKCRQCRHIVKLLSIKIYPIITMPYSKVQRTGKPHTRTAKLLLIEKLQPQNPQRKIFFPFPILSPCSHPPFSFTAIYIHADQKTLQ